MIRTIWAATRLVGGVAILAVVVWRLGFGPIRDGLSLVTGWSLALAAGIAVVTTVGAAWRWRPVAQGLGVTLPLRTAIAAYYRSQFLNTALPGGVLGDVHRAVRHGREVGDVGRGVRAVAWERCAGQVVQVVLALIVLVTFASPVRSSVRVVLLAVVVLAVVAGAPGAALLARTGPRGEVSRLARVLSGVNADIRAGLLARSAWPGIAFASVVVVAGHTATFLIAAWTAGSTASTGRMLPLAMLVLLAMAVPMNVGGWGPREGVAAWLFAAAGLGADQGVATATVYGVMTLAACLPGAAVLVVTRRRGDRRPGAPATGVDASRAGVDASGAGVDASAPSDAAADRPPILAAAGPQGPGHG